MAVSRWTRLVLFGAGFLGLAAYAIVRSLAPAGPTLVLEGPRTVRVTLAELTALPAIEREGAYQNQYGNWRDAGRYRGVALTVLLERYFPGVRVTQVRVEGADGYTVELPEERVYDPAYPLVLAYAMDGREIPEWPDGPRLVILPEQGRVGNAEYGVDSVGAFWVKTVVRILVETR
ncbi:MAG: molybdopterin-dependent oxidoreductase [Candidatus Acetothermia bacterium]|jgi:hypothetical protein|nr:molybdopterin-dependent oxidoreductase [Candidatus Acetothermia bacterium]